MAKGSAFERELCKALSKWWTNDVRDDVFWRTAGSGAMATTRAKTGNEAYGMHGDIRDTHPWGSILMRQYSVEAKRGYSGASFQDVLDSLITSAPQWYETVFHQALSDANSGSIPSWWVITRRDRRESLIWMPHFGHVHILAEFRAREKTWNLAHVRGRKHYESIKVLGFRLEDFFEIIRPEVFGGGQDLLSD